MSRLRRSMYTNKLDTLLSYADDDAFLQMIWAVDALQSDRVEAAQRYIAFPTGAASSDIGSPLAIYKWELETLVHRVLIAAKSKPQVGYNRHTNCSTFAACATAVRYLRKLEDAESKLYLGRFDVRTELHRAGHRQFHWQRGYFNNPQIYRHAYLYGGRECSAYFERTHGISISDFSAIGFGLYSAFREHPLVQRSFSMQAVGISDAARDAALRMLSISQQEARVEALELAQAVNAGRPQPLPVAYQPSLLRRLPVLQTGDGLQFLRCPLPELILQRVSTGVYYDLIGGPGGLRNEASDRFEDYAYQLLQAMLPGIAFERSFEYRADGNRVDSPDILVKAQNSIRLVVECKATKLSIGAQFAEDPIEEARRSYQEIAKGVLQIWKFFSHVRRGLVPDISIHDNASGMVLTLDSWLVMSGGLQDSVIADAAVLAARDPNIIAEDRRHVGFCSIANLEETLAFSNEDSFLRCIAASTEDRFKGWILSNVNRDLSEYEGEKRPYPFRLRDVLPWWATTENMREEGRGIEADQAAPI